MSAQCTAERAVRERERDGESENCCITAFDVKTLPDNFSVHCVFVSTKSTSEIY
jgi:hypothetical protein